MLRIALCVVMLAAAAIGSDSPEYQKGTITKKFVAEPGSSAVVFYALKAESRLYELKICGAFEDGQSVDFRVKGQTVFIRSEGDKEIKCPIQLTGPGKPVTYQKGTIEGTLRGSDMLYLVDYCGAFQAGSFTAGQVVEYRVDGERLFILHDEVKEYNCKIEGTHLP